MKMKSLTTAAIGLTGGSLGFADPEEKIGYGYIPNRKSVVIGGDPRDVALRQALYSATPAAQSR